MAKLRIEESTKPTAPPASSMLLYARNGKFYVLTPADVESAAVGKRTL